MSLGSCWRLREVIHGTAKLNNQTEVVEDMKEVTPGWRCGCYFIIFDFLVMILALWVI